MKRYTMVLAIEVDEEDVDELTPEALRALVYDAGGDWPFGFDITSVEEQ